MKFRAPRYLVVGGDSLIGSSLVSLLRSLRINVTATTRRPVAVDDENRVFLDISRPDLNQLSVAGYSVVFLCAAISNIATCEDDQEKTKDVNVKNTVALTKLLIANGASIIYLSSNSVFEGAIAKPEENTPCSPVCEYGRQKVDVEQQILSLATSESSVAIVRLSKVITKTVGIAAEFARNLRSGKVCTAFSDLMMCPVSIDYITHGLLAVANAKVSGIFHLSGEKEMSYAEFANYLAIYLGADTSLIHPISIEASSVRVVFRPTYPGLGMQRTTELLGITPEPTIHLMSTLV